MTLVDYVIDLALIALVFRQLHTRELTLNAVLLPLALCAVAAANYLRAFAPAGNDLLLIGAFSFIGLILGLVSGVATHVWRENQGKIVSKAGAVAAVSWVLGMGFRFLFAIYASTSRGGMAVARFSLRHTITSAQAWTTALVAMAILEVAGRTALLQYRRLHLLKSVAREA
jgi:ABC-type antimicrobial peptide transport system permease subunit